MNSNELNFGRGVVLPIKETLDFAKNTALVLAMQTLYLIYGKPSHGGHTWWSVMTAFGLALIGGLVAVFSVLSYASYWPEMTRSRRALVVAGYGIFIAICAFATRARLDAGF